MAIYTNGSYVSADLDLVNRYFVKRSVIKSAIEELGFKETGRHFEHPDTEYFVEFPLGPLAIGEAYDVKIVGQQLETGMLVLITPTECVKDRLVWYYHAGDNQSLYQAILVAKDQSIDLDEIMRWSEGEGKLEEFEKIKEKLRA